MNWGFCILLVALAYFVGALLLYDGWRRQREKGLGWMAAILALVGCLLVGVALWGG